MWCAMEIQTCSLICNEAIQMSKQDNYCNPATLEYKCRCSTWEPPMEQYEHTLPTFVCTKTYDDCVKSKFCDLAGQNKCTVNIKRFCGDLTPVPGGAAVNGILEANHEEETQSSHAWSDTQPATTSASNKNDKKASQLDSLLTTKDATSNLIPNDSNSTNTDKDKKDTNGNPSRDTGAKAGIAAGAIAGTALLGCVIYIYRLRKTAALSNTTFTKASELGQEENGTEASHSKPVAELGGQFHHGPELDGKALEAGALWWAAAMEQPGAIRGVPAAVHELEVSLPVELDATGNTFKLAGMVKKKSWVEDGYKIRDSSSRGNGKDTSV